ncbi:MAG TPA: hypothetical protein PK812_02040 [Beijerinckiaceae bacterium]|nr:hypothetical protein [Beijerinckiaceae bacterium]
MRVAAIAVLALVLPALGGCKMALLKGATRLALGAEQAETLDPLAMVRRQLRSPPPRAPSPADASSRPPDPAR